MLTTTRSLVGEILSRETENFRARKWLPPRKLKPCVRETPISPPDSNISGEEEGGGHGEEERVASCQGESRSHDKLELTTHKRLPKIWRILFLVTEGPPGRSFLNTAVEKKGLEFTVTHTHTHTHTQGSSYPNLNSLDGRRPRLNNPRFLPGLGSAEQSMTPADVCTINEPLPHTELWTVSVCIIWHCQCLSSEVKWADSKLI